MMTTKSPSSSSWRGETVYGSADCSGRNRSIRRHIVPLGPQPPRGNEPGALLSCYHFFAARSPISTAKLEMGRAVRPDVSVSLGGTRYHWQTVPFSVFGIWHTTVTLLSHCWRVKIGLLKGIKTLVGNFTFQILSFILHSLLRLKASVGSKRKRALA
jgi:hypothetical protein